MTINRRTFLKAVSTLPFAGLIGGVEAEPTRNEMVELLSPPRMLQSKEDFANLRSDFVYDGNGKSTDNTSLYIIQWGEEGPMREI